MILAYSMMELWNCLHFVKDADETTLEMFHAELRLYPPRLEEKTVRLSDDTPTRLDHMKMESKTRHPHISMN